MNLKNLLFVCCTLIIFVQACTPKVPEKTTDTKVETPHPATETPKVETHLSPCPKFSDAPNPDAILDEFVIYRDFLKAGDWNGAFEKWQKVYEVAPAADGQRNTVYSDGIRFYEYFISQTQDSVQRDAYVDRIYEIYDEIATCYPAEGGYVPGRKAFDYFYKYRHRATNDEIFALFKESIDTDGDNAQYFVINPFIALLVDMYFDEKISMEEAKRYQQIVRDRLARGLAECKGKECENWKIIEEYVTVRLEGFEGVKGFYACEYYENKYYSEFEANPTDCEVIRTVYSRFKFGDCVEDTEKFAAIRAAYKENCVEVTRSPISECYDMLRDSRYAECVECVEKVIADTEDNGKKAEYKLLIAKIYHAHLKNFSRARKYAKEAANLKSNWGDPYLLIARLYASSGPLCGPGRGWDSQIVVWPAIDMWNKAKRVDPSVTSEANKWINKYAPYMPSVEDVFQRSLKEGASYFVPCWIQETTTIRTAKK